MRQGANLVEPRTAVLLADGLEETKRMRLVAPYLIEAHTWHLQVSALMTMAQNLLIIGKSDSSV